MTAKRSPFRVHRWIDRALLAALPALGALHAVPFLWFTTFLATFATLCTAIFSAATFTTRWAEQKTERIQGPRRKPPMLREEAIVTAQAMWVMAALVAWPISAASLGQQTGFHWSLEGTGWTWWGALGVTLLGLVAVDAWTYWKHRALHTKWLFGFHRDHHTFRDPSAFAGFAVGPFESLWTFAPVLAVWHPQALHWGPAYITLVVAFVCLNMYLHCGVNVRWLEATLPRLGINTSAFHNVHHSHVRANFAEVATWWDRICKTRQVDKKLAPAGEA